MKKIIFCLLVLSSIALNACKGKQVPGAPYDNLPTFTPTAYYNVNFTVFSTQTPLANATVVLVYPDAIKTVIATTNEDGKTNFKVSVKGNYTAKFLHTSIAGSAGSPLYNSYTVTNGNNDYTIILDAGSVTLVAQSPVKVSFTAAAADYIYYIVYSNAGGMKRKIEANMGRYHSVQNLTTFSPAIIDAPGSSITVKISLPNFWHGEDLWPMRYYNLEISTYPYPGMGNAGSPGYWGAYADWLFSTKTASAIIFSPSTGTIQTTMQLFVQNVQMTNVCMEVEKYEYFIGGQWIDHAFYGGEPDYKVNGASEYVEGKHCFLNSSNFPIMLGYPGYTGTSATKGRLTLRFFDNATNATIIKAYIQS
jgi:hypothetical protein